MAAFVRHTFSLETVLLWGLMLGLLCASCSPAVQLGEEAARYENDLIRLQKRLADNPDDTEALRDIGIIYLRTRRYGEAYEQLKKAYVRDRDDPKTLFYLGTASELVGKQQEALQLYGRYSEMSRFSLYRRRLEGRYQWLVRKMAHAEMKERLAREEERSGAVSSRRVAVFPLVYQGTNPQYAPLGRGLSEMLMVDLAQVRRLNVVERVRLQALLDELKLAQSQYVDPETAPRVGRLLGAGRLLGGSYEILDEEELRLDVTLTQLEAPARLPDMESRTGVLDRLFRLEKELVFRVIEALNVELTPEERRAIEKVPTQNLQAFLAYSRGLAHEDVGNYTEAFEAYKRAHSLDPSFEAAAARMETAVGLSLTAGPAQEALETVLSREPMSSSSINLLDSRLNNLNQSISSIFVPGRDARQPGLEAFGPPLPDPPAPPSEQK